MVQARDKRQARMRHRQRHRQEIKWTFFRSEIIFAHSKGRRRDKVAVASQARESVTTRVK